MVGPSLQGPRRNNNPDELSEYARRLIDLRRQMNDLTGSILKSAGIDVSPDGMTINSALDVLGSLSTSGPAAFGGDTDVTGSLDVTGPMTVGGTMSVTGPMSVGGTMTVTGDATFAGNLAVPNGSITNAALANPVTGAAGNNAATTSITTGYVDYATVIIPVPAGFTRANVLGVSAISTPASQADTLSTVINSTVGTEMPTFGTAASSALAVQISGLSGGSISVSSRARNIAGSGAGARVLTTSATITFLK